MKKNKSFHLIRPIIPVLIIIQTLLLSWAVSAEEIRPRDWSKLKGGAGDDALAITCATVLEHTQKDMGKAWLDKIAETKKVDRLLDFARIEGKQTRGRRRAIEDCIRPVEIPLDDSRHARSLVT